MMRLVDELKSKHSADLVIDEKLLILDRLKFVLKLIMKKEKQYKWNAEDYAKHSSAQKEWARELIAKLKLKGHESVLDIGCGDGKITAEIARYVPDGNVVGIDSSEAMIQLANTNFPPKRHPNLSFQLCDARELPFNGKFDIVFSNAALHWIKDHKPVIKGVKNSLKANGRLLLQMGGKGNAESMISIVEIIISEKEWNHYFSGLEFPYRFHDADEYKALLEEADLLPLRLELIPKRMSYQNRDGLAGWIRTTWLPYTSRVPDDKREKFISLLVARYIEKYPLDDHGNIYVDMVRLEVEASQS